MRAAILQKPLSLLQKLPASLAFKRRATTPTLLQMEAVECGAAALGIVLRYYGAYVPLEQIRVQCGVGRDGVNAKNIIQAARHYGLVAKGFKKNLEDLSGLPKPAILFWNFNHFLVLEGIAGNKVYLNDPASGPRMVSLAELDESFTGVVLTLTPGPEFQPVGSPPGLLKPLLSRLHGASLPLTFALTAGLLLVIPGLTIPAFSAMFVDNVLVGKLHYWLHPLLLGMGITALLRGALTGLREACLLRLETRLSVSTSSRFLKHILHLPMQFFSQRYAGEISSRVALNDQVAKLLSGKLATTAIDLVMVQFYLLIMFLYDWTLALIGLGIAVVNATVLKLVARKREDGNRRTLQERGKFLGTAIAGLSNIETIKASGTEDDFFARLAGYQGKMINSQQLLGMQTLPLTVIPTLMTQLSTVLVLSLGGFRVIDGVITMGTLVAFQSLMSSFMTPVINLTNISAELQMMQGNMNRLDDVLQYPVDEEKETVQFPAGLQRLSGHLELRNIAFGYSPLAPPLVENFNLTLRPGSRVALVGSSGCGKSTLAKIVCGLYPPWSGEVLFDGLPREQIPAVCLQDSVAFVDQDVFLFAGTIRDNLTLWDKDIPDMQIHQACKDALIHEDIMARKRGYDSPMDEGGANFSGGQRQRIEIARALVNNPRILVMDEATSALDSLSEQRIDENLRRRGCTCLIVAHRLSTIRDSDEIIVLDKGKVVQRGTHEGLMQDADGLYYRLMQS